MVQLLSERFPPIGSTYLSNAQEHAELTSILVSKTMAISLSAEAEDDLIVVFCGVSLGGVGGPGKGEA